MCKSLVEDDFGNLREGKKERVIFLWSTTTNKCSHVNGLSKLQTKSVPECWLHGALFLIQYQFTYGLFWLGPPLHNNHINQGVVCKRFFASRCANCEQLEGKVIHQSQLWKIEIELWFQLPLGITSIVQIGLAKRVRSYGKVIAFLFTQWYLCLKKDCFLSNLCNLLVTKTTKGIVGFLL